MDDQNIEKFQGFKFEISYEDIVEKNCEELAREISDDAKSRWGANSKYAKDWTYHMKKDKSGKYGVVYNKEHYRLTHLLEFGHIVWNGRKTKRTKPQAHILPKYQKQKEKYIKDMERAKVK